MTVITTETAHSWFSPSQATRLIRCPGSRKACEGLPDKSSPDAFLGTQNHKFMELYYSGAGVQPETFSFSEEAQVEQVERACAITNKILTDLMAVHGQPEITLEHATQLPYGGVFGTVDMKLWFPITKHLVTLDYKFGYNAVDATDNEQLLTYGVAESYEHPEAETFDFVIVQPRVGNGQSVWATDRAFISQWEENVLKPAIVAAQDDNAPRIPGYKQCLWCKFGRQKGCPEQANPFVELAQTFEQAQPSTFMPAEMAAAELAKLVDRLPEFELLIKHLSSAVFTRLENGENIPGYKLVRKGTRRRWINEASAGSYLQRKKLTEAERYEKKLISPSKAYTLLALSKAGVREQNTFKNYVEYPLGELTFAPVTDPREAVNLMEEMIAATEAVEPEVQEAPQVEVAAPDLSSLF